MFNTVLHELRSAKNVGMIARSHLAFGGNHLILIGDKNKWNFKGGTSTYTRKLIHLERLLFFDNFELFLRWNNNKFKTIAIEITENAKSSENYNFPSQCNIVLGNERIGLTSEIINQCDEVITIPQIGTIGSLNVAVSASIIFYELNKKNTGNIIGNKFAEINV